MLKTPRLCDPEVFVQTGIGSESAVPAMPYSAKRCISPVRMCNSRGNKGLRSEVVPRGNTVVCKLCKERKPSDKSSSLNNNADALVT